MNVMYTCDNNYVRLMGISMISLFESNRDIANLKVYLIGNEISQSNKDKLSDIANKYDREIEIIDTPELNIPSSLTSSRWPSSAFTRLFAGKILSQKVKKILYLDCDTIISGSISDLGKIDFGDKIILGVRDCVSGIYKENIGLKKDSIYINAGVIFFDLSKLREIDIASEMTKYVEKYEKNINYADQDILNGFLKGRIGELDPKYNVMTINAINTYQDIIRLRRPTNYYCEKELESAKSNPLIIHYTTNMLIVRPWFKNTNHPFASAFKKNMMISPWKDIELSKMIFKSKESLIISLISILPKKISYSILGLIHAKLKPLYIRNFMRK